jgi:hypothetical protein
LSFAWTLSAFVQALFFRSIDKMRVFFTKLYHSEICLLKCLWT